MALRNRLGVVDQAIKSLTQVKEYIHVGMDTAIDVALDLVEHEHEKPKGLDKVKNIMADYVLMERDMEQFQEAISKVKEKALSSGDSFSLEEYLNNTVNALSVDERAIEEHEKYKELVEKIKEAQNPDEVPIARLGLGPGTANNDEDIAISQQEVNIRCPYTGKDMTHPVRNKFCGHNYEKEGILHYIKERGKRAKCPFGGCVNQRPLEASCLEDNKELKKYIDAQKKHRGKKN